MACTVQVDFELPVWGERESERERLKRRIEAAETHGGQSVLLLLLELKIAFDSTHWLTPVLYLIIDRNYHINVLLPWHSLYYPFGVYVLKSNMVYSGSVRPSSHCKIQSTIKNPHVFTGVFMKLSYIIIFQRDFNLLCLDGGIWENKMIGMN